MDQDQRAGKLAHTLVTYSLKVKPGEKVLIETRGADLPFTADLIKEVYAAGGLPFLSIKYPYLEREIMNGLHRGADGPALPPGSRPYA